MWEQLALYLCWYAIVNLVMVVGALEVQACRACRTPVGVCALHQGQVVSRKSSAGRVLSLRILGFLIHPV